MAAPPLARVCAQAPAGVLQELAQAVLAARHRVLGLGRALAGVLLGLGSPAHQERPMARLPITRPGLRLAVIGRHAPGRRVGTARALWPGGERVLWPARPLWRAR